MGQSRSVKGRGSARTEGARRATGVRADGAAGVGALGPGQRWAAGRKREVVLRLLRGESLDALSREVGVEIYRLEDWKERALAALERGLKDQIGEPGAAALDAAALWWAGTSCRFPPFSWSLSQPWVPCPKWACAPSTTPFP